MKIGIIGAGLIGKLLAKKISAAGHQVVVADARGVESLRDFTQQSGIQAVEVADATDGAQVLLLTIPMRNIPEVAQTLQGKLREDLVVVETTNYWPYRDGVIEAVDQGMVNSVWVQQQLGHPVVKAFSNMAAYSLFAEGKPAGSPGRLALAVASDVPAATAVVCGLVNDIGFDALDTGPLVDSWRQQPGSPAYCTDLTLPELVAARQAAQREKMPELQQESLRLTQNLGEDYFSILLSGQYPAGFVDHVVDINRAVSGLPPRAK